MKYNSLIELQRAYDANELNPETHKLVLDNDNSSVYIEDGEKVFEGGGRHEIAEELLDLVGIPWEQC